MTTQLERARESGFESLTQYKNDMKAASRIRDYILSDEDKPHLNITRLTPEYSTTGNNVENITESRKQLYISLREKFPNRGRF